MREAWLDGQSSCPTLNARETTPAKMNAPKNTNVAQRPALATAHRSPPHGGPSRLHQAAHRVQDSLTRVRRGVVQTLRYSFATRHRRAAPPCDCSRRRRGATFYTLQFDRAGRVAKKHQSSNTQATASAASTGRTRPDGTEHQQHDTKRHCPRQYESSSCSSSRR